MGRRCAPQQFRKKCRQLDFDQSNIGTFGFEFSQFQFRVIRLQPRNRRRRRKRKQFLQQTKPHAPMRGDQAVPDKLTARSDAELAKVGRVGRLAAVAAVVGMEVRLNELSSLLSIEPTRLAGLMANLCEHGIFRLIPGRYGQQIYRFTDPAIRAAAYSRLPISVRKNCHSLFARALAEQDDRHGRTAEHYEAIASHLAQADRHEEAAAWWQRAAQAAVVSGNSRLAIPLLQNACDAGCTAGPNNHRRRAVARKPRLQPSKENGSPAVLELYRSCLPRRQETIANQSRLVFDAKWGLMTYHLTHGDLPIAINLGHDLLALAYAGNSDAGLVLAHRLIGLTRLLAGHIDSAHFHLSCAIRHYRPQTTCRSTVSIRLRPTGVGVCPPCLGKRRLWQHRRGQGRCPTVPSRRPNDISTHTR